MAEKIEKKFMFNNFSPLPPRNSCLLWDSVEILGYSQRCDLVCRTTKVRIQRHILTVFSAYYLHNLWIPSGFLKRFTAKLTKPEKVRNNLSAISICLAKSPVWRRPWSKEIFFASMQHFALHVKTYVSFLFDRGHPVVYW